LQNERKEAPSVEAMVRGCRSEWSVRSQVEALCLEALAHHADANLSEAAKLLTKALTISQAKGFHRIFLDEGMRMAASLQATLPTLPNRTLSLFAATLLHSFSSDVTSHIMATSSMVQLEALSQQERRVLRLLSAGLSNAEIARELVVSANTIRHTKSIIALNVNSRNEAREVARELKLLDLLPAFPNQRTNLGEGNPL
jgi:LuxR family maltose regulon positive regulatory protein